MISEYKAGEMTQVASETGSKREEREGAISCRCCVRIAVTE